LKKKLQKRSERNRTLAPTKTNHHANARTDDKKRAKKRSRLNAKKNAHPGVATDRKKSVLKKNGHTRQSDGKKRAQV
jgi:hypothetical protein